MVELTNNIKRQMLSALSAMTGSSGEEHPAWVQKIHKLNDVLHQHPYDYLANGLFWYLLLLFSFPLFAMGTIVSALYNVVHYYLLRKEILPKNFRLSNQLTTWKSIY